MDSKPTVVSLFSGCGGLDLGFEAAGFRTVAMLEWADYATETLRRNFPTASIVGPPDYSGDINDAASIQQLPTKSVDVLVGGPPCQSFSIAAAQRFLKGDKKFKRTGFKDKKRGGLVYRYLEVLERIRPKVFVIENVPGFMELDNGRELRELLAFCQDLGYSMSDPFVAQAAEYGVPQFRQRLIICGVRGRRSKKILMPPATHGSATSLFDASLDPFVTVAQALAELSSTAPNNVPRQHLRTSVERYRRLRFGQREPLGRVDRLDPRRPSKTVIAGGMNGGGRSHLHPFLARTLTVRECARLQTFPDSFEFFGNISRQFTQVGNAVPPLLAETIARSIGAQAFGMSHRNERVLLPNQSKLSVQNAIDQLCAEATEYREFLYRDLLAS